MKIVEHEIDGCIVQRKNLVVNCELDRDFLIFFF